MNRTGKICEPDRSASHPSHGGQTKSFKSGRSGFVAR